MSKLPSSIVLAAIAAALVTAVPAAAQNLPFTETVRESFPLGPGGVFSLENINGAVAIEAWEGHEVVVEAEKRSDSQVCLDALRLEFETGPTRVFVKAHYPDSRCRHEDPRGQGRGQTQVEFKIRVPRYVQVDKVKLVNGQLTVEGVEGGVVGASVNGRVVARGVSGSVALSTVNGTVEAELGYLAGDDRVELRSVNGTVQLTLPAGAGARVKANTTNGSIRNDAGLTVTRGRYVGSTMEGQLGSGSAEVMLRTVNGAITLTTR